jgi:hypothetical protein
MINQWIDAIANVILAAPGNADSGAGPLWPSTIVRLGELSTASARENRIFEDFFEADTDPNEVAGHRPFFVVFETDAQWIKFQQTGSLQAHGALDVVYTERALRNNDGEGQPTVIPSHTACLRYFRGFADAMIRWVAENSRIAGVPVAGVKQLVFPQRTPRVQRDPQNRDTDYLWAAWRFTIGEAVH